MDENAPATKKDLLDVRTELIGLVSQTKTELQDQIWQTKTDLQEEIQQSKTELREEMRQTKTELQDQMRKFHGELQEQMRDMQTELLRAFQPWAENIQLQFRELDANTGNSVTAIKARIAILERRLGQIEKKLLLEPPAA